MPTCTLSVFQNLTHELSRDGVLVTSEGTVYPLLARLRRDGVVATEWRESAAGPPRRYYRLTPSGEAALVTFEEQWRRFSGAVDAVLKGEWTM
jgi:PadR family transcriptional regulator PadR